MTIDAVTNPAGSTIVPPSPAATEPNRGGGIWTENLGAALTIYLVAAFAAYLPAMIHFIELLWAKHEGLYDSSIHTLSESFLGSTAVCVSVSLNHAESMYDDVEMGKASHLLCILSMVGAITSLVGYSLVHFLAPNIFDPKYDNGSFLIFAMTQTTLAIFFSCATVLQDRRVKDIAALDR